jgi:hypothetical protein
MKIFKFKNKYMGILTRDGKHYPYFGQTRLEVIQKALEEIKLTMKGYLII